MCSVCWGGVEGGQSCDCRLIIQVQPFTPVTQQWEKRHFDIVLGAEASLICPVTV